MKYLLIIISIVFLFSLFLFGCSETNNSNSLIVSQNKTEQSQTTPEKKISVIEETMDEPVKVIYQKNYEYSALFETEDKKIIQDLINALNKIKILSETNIAVDDYEDVITFVSADGETTTVRFECKRLLKNDKRYDVNGYEAVNDVLLSFSDTEDVY